QPTLPIGRRSRRPAGAALGAPAAAICRANAGGGGTAATRAQRRAGGAGELVAGASELVVASVLRHRERGWSQYLSVGPVEERNVGRALAVRAHRRRRRGRRSGGLVGSGTEGAELAERPRCAAVPARDGERAGRICRLVPPRLGRKGGNKTL